MCIPVSFWVIEPLINPGLLERSLSPFHSKPLWLLSHSQSLPHHWLSLICGKKKNSDRRSPLIGSILEWWKVTGSGNILISRSEQTKSSNAPCTCAALDAGLLCSAQSKPDIPVIYSHSQKSNAITFSAHFLLYSLTELIICVDFGDLWI